MGRSRLARLGFAVAAGLLAAGVLGTPAAAAGSGTIQGTFTTSAEAPIAGASVVAYTADQEWLADTTTDEAGHYRLTGVAAGGVLLQFDDAGRALWSPGVPESEAATVYDLAAGGTLTVDERQPATGKVTGHFTDASGAPARAAVYLQGRDNAAYLNASTDEEGAWSVDAFPGTYQVSFRWDSSLQWAVQQLDQQSAAPVTVTAGETSTVDDHKLPTGTAGGRLTTPAGGPLAGAQVTLHRADESLGWSSTDEDGNYSFGEVIAADGYTVSFSAGDGAEQWVSGATGPGEARNFTITAGESTTIDDQQLSTSTLHGRLADKDGKPLVGYQVSATLDDDDNWVNFSAETDDDGRWSVSGVFPGDYRVAFSTPDWGRVQWAYGKTRESAATLIPVAAGASVTVDDTWLPAATLIVNAVDAVTGTPIANYCVWVDTPSDGSGCTTGSQITVGDLPGGDFHVSIYPDESSYYLMTDDVPVKLVAGETTTVTVPVEQGGKVAFAATDHATGKAVARTCAVFMTLGRGGLPDGYGDCTDGTGNATTTAQAAGTYEFFAVAPDGYGHQWVGSAGGTGDQRAAARIVVRPGTTVQAPAVLLDRPGKITGVVSDPAGKPLAWADVAFSAWGDAGPAWNTDVDAEGHYTLDRLGPYAWPLLFSGAGYPRQWSGHVGNRFQAATVPVVAGSTSTYNFTLAEATSTLKGKVSVPSAPAASWRLNVVNAATGDQMGMFDSYSAGVDGAYSLAMTGGQQVKVRWSFYQDDSSATGWYDHAADISTARKVDLPAGGTRKLSLILR